MKHYEKIEVRKTEEKYLGFTCDKCGQYFPAEDWIENQESFSYSFTGGFGSVFGDMCSYQIDLCQKCLDETIGKYLKRNNYEEGSY